MDGASSWSATSAATASMALSLIHIYFQVMQKLIAEMEQHYRDAGVEFENWEIGSRIEKHFVYNYGAETMQLLRENGWNAANLPPYSFGYIYLPSLFGIVIVSMFTAPLGARLAQTLPVPKLKKCFALLLIVVGIRMLLKAL